MMYQVCAKVFFVHPVFTSPFLALFTNTHAYTQPERAYFATVLPSCSVSTAALTRRLFSVFCGVQSNRWPALPVPRRSLEQIWCSSLPSWPLWVLSPPPLAPLYSPPRVSRRAFVQCGLSWSNLPHSIGGWLLQSA